jgi:FtsZ-binding cell division protein ZapB
VAPSRKFWVIIGGIATLIAISLFIVDIEKAKQKAWQIIKPDLMAQNSNLRNENELLKSENESLKNQNLRLKRYLDAYEHNFIELKDAATNCCQNE